MFCRLSMKYPLQAKLTEGTAWEANRTREDAAGIPREWNSLKYINTAGKAEQHRWHTQVFHVDVGCR